MRNDLISQSKCTQTDLITQQKELAAVDLVCIFFEVFILVLQNFGNMNKQITGLVSVFFWRSGAAKGVCWEA